MNQIHILCSALQGVRAPLSTYEYELHTLIQDALTQANISFLHEAPLARGRRIDFLCGTVGIEIKRGRPQRTPLLSQLSAYAACELLSALILVAEHPPRLPCSLAGKPLHVISLQRLWGVAL